MSKTIVLADDSVTIQKVVELTFMDEDYRVVAFGNGEEALASFETVTPDLVIADVHMPGANGYEVCRRSKARFPAVPVLLLVGTFEPFDENQAQVAGASTFLKKPFDSQELLRLVDNLMAAAPAPVPAPAEQLLPSVPDDEATGVLQPELPAVEESVVADWDLVATAPQTPVSLAAAAPAAASPVADFELPVLSPPPAAAPAAPSAGYGGNGSGNLRLSDEDIDKVARRVVEILSERVVREVAWEVIPDLAEVVIKDRLRELESQVE
jgi:CheY-like chemotaxis protein